jgi:hypothetical protein
MYSTSNRLARSGHPLTIEQLLRSSAVATHSCGVSGLISITHVSAGESSGVLAGLGRRAGRGRCGAARPPKSIQVRMLARLAKQITGVENIVPEASP